MDDELLTPEEAIPATPDPPQPVWSRLAFGSEFLIAMLTATVIWSIAGGQGHLDLMPWYWKLGLPIAFAFCAVRATAASVHGERALGPMVVIWILLAMIAAGSMGLVTYYYHLQEEIEGAEPEGETLTSVRLSGRTGA